MSDSVYPKPGRLIADKYQLDAMIGEGAMGTVWAATHVNLNQRVAVKLILPELADSESIRARFEAEAKAAAALRSRFVVQVYDSGINEEGVPYLVMEYLQGESLEALVDRSGPLGLEYGVQVMAQVAKGLSRAHSQGIVHRDLKPANVFLAQTDDGEEVAKILDFGIAKFQRDAPSVSATATGTVVGTPLFMSPEQARGKKGVDHRSDLYSLGAMTFWTLTGRHAFGGEALGELILAICTKPLPSLAATAPGLPAALDDWYAKACAREPDDRFQSADELVAALLEASGLDESALRAVGVVTRQTDHTGRFALRSSPELRIASTLVGSARGSGAPPGSNSQSAATSAATVLVGATQAGVSRTAPSEPPAKRRPNGKLIASLVAVASVVALSIGVALSGAPRAPASQAAATSPAPLPSARSASSASTALRVEPAGDGDPELAATPTPPPADPVPPAASSDRRPPRASGPLTPGQQATPSATSKPVSDVPPPPKDPSIDIGF